MCVFKDKKAFTILELVIVLAVLAILIGISVPKIKGMMLNANIAKARKEVQTIGVALETYKTNVNPPAYPLSTSPITNLQATYLITATPNMLNKVLYDPFAAANTEYSYMTSPNDQYYIIWSVGPTGLHVPTAVDNNGYVTYS